MQKGLKGSTWRGVKPCAHTDTKKREREREREKGKGHEYDRTKISWNLRWKVVEVDEEVVGVIIVTIVDCKIDSYNHGRSIFTFLFVITF